MQYTDNPKLCNHLVRETQLSPTTVTVCSFSFIFQIILPLFYFLTFTILFQNFSPPVAVIFKLTSHLTSTKSIKIFLCILTLLAYYNKIRTTMAKQKESVEEKVTKAIQCNYRYCTCTYTC